MLVPGVALVAPVKRIQGRIIVVPCSLRIVPMGRKGLYRSLHIDGLYGKIPISTLKCQKLAAAVPQGFGKFQRGDHSPESGRTPKFV
jgi:hypothetical protein